MNPLHSARRLRTTDEDSASTARDRVNQRHLIPAFLLGALVPVVLNAVAMGPFWMIALLVGACVGGLMTLLIAVPVVLLLRARNALTIWLAVPFAGLLAALPDVMISLSALGGNLSLYAHGHQLIEHGWPTSAGFVHFFVLRPAVYWVAGALGGLTFWIIAVGPRLKA